MDIFANSTSTPPPPCVILPERGFPQRGASRRGRAGARRVGACTRDWRGDKYRGGTQGAVRSAPSSRYHSDTWLISSSGMTDPGLIRCVQLASGVARI